MKQISTTKTLATIKSKSKPAARKPAVAKDDAPKLTAKDFARAKFRVAGQTATRSQWQAAVQARLAEGKVKQRISIMLDAPIIEHFKAAAGERGYQTLINDTLRRAVEGEHFVEDMRAVIREELSNIK
jgi:uncharacterized protein (DUF4415 family)